MSMRHVHALMLALFSLGLSACQPEEPQIIRPSPLPQDEKIQVYMNHEPASSYTEPYRGYTRDGDNLEQIIIDTISGAQSKVDVAVQELRLPGIAQALVDRQKAGVRVRVILENTYSRPYSQIPDAEVQKLDPRERDRYQEARQLIDLNHDNQLSQDEIDQRDALVILDNARIPRIDDTADGSAGSNLMHDKFVIVDHRIVISTSSNFTTSDVHGDFKSQHSRGNANNLLRIDSPDLASLFTQEFDQMWGDGPGGAINSRFGVKKPFRAPQSITVGTTRVDVHFSPSSRSIDWEHTSNGLIGKTLSSAKQLVEMALFVFSDQPLVDGLEKTHQQGVEINALIDPAFAYRSYSEALDMMGIALAEECKLESSNHPWKTAIATVGVPRMPPGDLLHHKFGIVDRQTVITGSHNWTDAANTGNDETVLVVHNPIVAAHYQREFERLYANAILGIPPAIRKKVAANTKNCPAGILPQAQEPSRLIGGFQPGSSSQKRKPPLTSVALHRQKHPASDRSLLRKSYPTPRGSAPPPLAAKRQIHRKNQTQRVNFNTATQAELETLPGIGPGLAKRIIAARQKRRFTSLATIDQVPGIGPKLLNQLKDKIIW